MKTQCVSSRFDVLRLKNMASAVLPSLRMITGHELLRSQESFVRKNVRGSRYKTTKFLCLSLFLLQ